MTKTEVTTIKLQLQATRLKIHISSTRSNLDLWHLLYVVTCGSKRINTVITTKHDVNTVAYLLRAFACTSTNPL